MERLRPSQRVLDPLPGTGLPLEIGHLLPERYQLIEVLLGLVLLFHGFGSRCRR